MAQKIVSLDAIRLIEEELGLKFTIYLTTTDFRLANLLEHEIVKGYLDTQERIDYLVDLRQCYLDNRDKDSSCKDK